MLRALGVRPVQAKGSNSRKSPTTWPLERRGPSRADCVGRHIGIVWSIRYAAERPDTGDRKSVAAMLTGGERQGTYGSGT